MTGSPPSPTPRHVAVLAAEVLHFLAPAPGDQTAIAKAVNDLGASCGFSWYGIYRTSPVVWSADASHTPTALPTLPGTVHGNAIAVESQVAKLRLVRETAQEVWGGV